MTNRLTARGSHNPETSRLINKIERVRIALSLPAGLNRFEAERIGDHCLNSTVARLRELGESIYSRWEKVPTRYCADGVRVLRYWLTGGNNL